jgi:tetratricopeptide (TPR) repeat protein
MKRSGSRCAVTDRSIRKTPRLRRIVARAAVSIALMMSVSTAHAGKVDTSKRMDALESEVQRLSATAGRLDRTVAPGRGFITRDKAIRRYEDYVYYHLIGRYEQAAEGFYTLVTTASLTDSGFHGDAEWYLAESLYKMGNLRTAEANYRVIVNNESHIFRQDAVRRLLEIYVDLDDEFSFEDLYQSEIVSGRVGSSDLVVYAVGKAFFRKGDIVEAKSTLNDVSRESPYYRKSQYILGAIMVLEGNLDAALQIFRAIVELSVETSDDRRVLDLSLLALGRIHMHRGQFQEASSHYGRISADSEYLADKLYEEVWTYIKQKEELRRVRVENLSGRADDELAVMQRREQDLVQQALRGVDIFLLKFADHQYAGQLRLVRGHLHIQAVEYQQALTAYEGVIADYAPIRERFRDLADSSEKPREYFQKLLAHADAVDGSADQLPAFAVSMVMSDRELSKAITIYRDLEQQRQMLAMSETIIGELRGALQNATGIGGFENIRYEAQFARSLIAQRHFELVELEELVLEDSLSGDARRQLGSLRDPRLAAQAVSLQAVSDGDYARLQSDIDELRRVRQGYRAQVQDATTQGLFSRIDGMHTALRVADRVIADAEGRLVPLEQAELRSIRARFDREVLLVEQQRGDLTKTLAEAEEVSIELTRSGFGRLEDFFADSVLRADVGIVDVYWAQKVEVSDEKRRVIEERNNLRTRILNRFEQVEQKLRI